jgi:hypothetical protein
MIEVRFTAGIICFLLFVAVPSFAQSGESIIISVTYLDSISNKDSITIWPLTKISDNDGRWSKPNSMTLNVECGNLRFNGDLEIWIEENIEWLDKKGATEWIPVKVLANRKVQAGTSTITLENLQYNSTGFISSNYFVKNAFRFTVVYQADNQGARFYYYEIPFDD